MVVIGGGASGMMCSAVAAERGLDVILLEPTRRAVIKKPVVVKDIDWTLCRERCANCGANGCKCGAKLPPQMWERPTAPEECSKFKEQSR